jgi:hypothetical protein
LIDAIAGAQEHGKTPKEAVDFLMNLLKNNDNSGNKVTFNSDKS